MGSSLVSLRKKQGDISPKKKRTSCAEDVALFQTDWAIPIRAPYTHSFCHSHFKYLRAKWWNSGHCGLDLLWRLNFLWIPLKTSSLKILLLK